jgi:hypothetical protein
VLLLNTPEHQYPESQENLCTPALNRKRETTSPSSNFLLHVIDLRDFATGNFGLEVLELVITLWQSTLNFLADLDALVNVRGDSLEIFLAETTGGHGWGTNADAAWCEG